MNGMVLSAGYGTRLRPYTDTIPKPAIPFLTVPLACYPLALFEKQKINNLVINTHHLPEKITHLYEHLKWPMSSPPQKLIFSAEPKQILGSGGGVRHALESLLGHGVFFVANADEVILPAHHEVIKDALAFHRHHGGIATLLSLPHPEVGIKFGGLWLPESSSLDGRSKISQFSKTKIPGHRGLHFVGVMLLSDSIEKYFFADDSKEENILYDTLTLAMTKGESVHAFEIDAQWFETGNPHDFLSASEFCLKAIQATPLTAWAQYLRQLICRCGTHQFLVEKDVPLLETNMQLCVKKILSGEI